MSTPTRILKRSLLEASSTERIRLSLEGVLSRLHAKLDQINGADDLVSPCPDASHVALRVFLDEDGLIRGGDDDV